MPRKDDDVENDWNEEEVCGRPASMGEAQTGDNKKSSHMGKMSW